jgi:hypothetical protein
MAQAFVGKLFNISDSGGAARVNEWVNEQLTALHGSPAESHNYFVGAPTCQINENIFMFVVLANANPDIVSTTIGTTTNSVTREIQSDGGAAFITAMTNYAQFAIGSPAAATAKVRALSLTEFENILVATAVLSD